MKTQYELIIRPGIIDFAPATLIQEVMQNIITICSTAKYSVPMDREFGININFLDEPINNAKAKYSAEIINAVRMFEPRVRITHIDFENDINGKIFPKIKFKLIV